jgi:HSP20 family protein
MRNRTYNQMMHDFNNWANAMNRVFANTVAPYDYSGNGGSRNMDERSGQGVRLPVDIWQAEEAFTINAYLPGVDPESVQITWENDELLIQGEMPTPSVEGEWLRRELFHGPFERRIGFNVPVDVDNIQADYHNGLLTLTVPKAEAVRPKQIKVQAR